MLSAPNPRPRALLWDIDGTLIDTTTLIVAALDHTYRTFLGRSAPPDELRSIIGTPLSSQLRLFGDPGGFGQDSGEMEAEFIRYYEANRSLERVIKPAVDALVRGVVGGRPTALVTSKNDAELANTLPRLGIASLVPVVISADTVTHPKPHPEGILLALRLLGESAEAAIYIGDTVHDMRAGKAAGVRRCAVTWGAAGLAALTAEEPELLCSRPEDLSHTLGIPPPGLA